jgi:hypothetical protein
VWGGGGGGWDGVIGGRRKLCNEEVRDGYCLPNIIRTIQSRRIRWDGSVARIGIT